MTFSRLIEGGLPWMALVAWSMAGGPLHAQVAPASPATAAAGWTVEEVAQISCPVGLERFLPGSYYYCIGRRDMALGDTARSRKMLRIASSWGSKPAQFLLGIGYYKGDAWPADRPLGLAWMGLAAERHDPAYAAVFTSAWQHASAREQAKAQALWQAMRPTYGDARAAHRAELRYRNEMMVMARDQIYGAKTCVEGINSGKITSATIKRRLDPNVLDNEPACWGARPPDEVASKIEPYAAELFDGWKGHVTVGALKQVDGPSK